MKKGLLLVSFLLFTISTLFAKHVELNDAQKVGFTFLITKTNTPISDQAQLSIVYTEDNISASAENAFFYVFNVCSGGFVIIAGDDVISPVLAYSHEGSFNPNNLAQNTQKWLGEYRKQIQYALANEIAADYKTQQDWKNLREGKNTDVQMEMGVLPLMQTKWNQAPNENGMCPSGSVTGCVATAMAQIMKYWNYPASGTGFHSYNHQTYGTLSANFGSTTYNWSAMPNILTSPNTAVATLMYQVGVSVNMQYSPQSSGAYVIVNSPTPQACSEYALKTYFGYKSTLHSLEKDNMTETQWIAMLKAELDASRPVLYAGFGSGGGHCFVTDGYDDNGFFHFNWGWGGSADGYFATTALNPGSLGTGGGSGGYNTGQQVVIGIEPPSSTGTTNYNLELYNFLTPSASTIAYGQGFNITTNIANAGTSNYSGDYGMAIFDAANNFVDFIQILSGMTLASGNVYTNNLTFSTTGMFSMLPGTYYAAVFYRPTGGNWSIVANGGGGGYVNSTVINVVNPNDIELNSNMVVTPGTTLTQGQTASVNLNIVNDGFSTFLGVYDVSLYNLDGSFAQSIGTYNETVGLPPGYTYLSPYITFTTPSITVAPGTYLLAVLHNPNNSGWQLTGSSYFQNPIYVTVVAPGIQPDIYEVNNTLGQSYTFPVSFSGNSASINTTGSTIHTNTDNDYYKIVLPSGFDYIIDSRLHDSYNSGNGNTYTVDGLFSWSTDGTTWSNAFDDIPPTNLTVLNGGTVYFQVAPYFAGEMGTYLLSMNITRSATGTSGITESELAEQISIYPNPAKDILYIDLNSFTGTINQIEIMNIQGQIVGVEKAPLIEEKLINLSLKNYSEGVYFVRMHAKEALLTKKIIVKK